MHAIKPFLTTRQATIKSAWKQLNDNGYKILFVVDDDTRLCGSVTDGDIRRWILRDRPLSAAIADAMCATPVTATVAETPEQLKHKMLASRLECMPVLNDGVIERLVFWDDLFAETPIVTEQIADVPVVIMAGGRGERLEPFTSILPKPLMPIGDQPLIQVIMGRFKPYGVQRFLLSLNYKSNLIRAYFQDCEENFRLSYHEEDRPLGTIGALSLMEAELQSTFIVSNCDIIVEANYADIVGFHRSNRNLITLVCSMRHVSIPYGIVEIENGGTLKSIDEKPEYDVLVNTGFYVLEPELIRAIPKGERFDVTHLIGKLRQEQQKIGVYPIGEKSWMDIGELDAYQDVLRRLR